MTRNKDEHNRSSLNSGQKYFSPDIGTTEKVKESGATAQSWLKI